MSVSAERQTELAEVRRVLGLRVDPYRPAEFAEQPLGQVDHLLKSGDLVAPVEQGVVLPDRRDPLLRTERLQLLQGEVLGEPAGHRDAVENLRRLPRSELRVRGDVRRTADLRLVPGHQHVVPGRDEVRLDVVGAHPGGQLVRRQRVLRSVSRRAAMSDHHEVVVAPRVGEPNLGGSNILLLGGGRAEVDGLGHEDGSADGESRGGGGDEPAGQHRFHRGSPYKSGTVHTFSASGDIAAALTHPPGGRRVNGEPLRHRAWPCGVDHWTHRRQWAGDLLASEGKSVENL